MSFSHRPNFNLSSSKRALLDSLLQEEHQPVSSVLKPDHRSSDEGIPLSFAQERLWFLDQFQPGLPIYNIPLLLQFPGPLNVTALIETLREIVRRHETLRTRLPVRHGQPVQVIGGEIDLEVPVLDLRDMPASMREAEVQRLGAKEAQHVFDLARGPLFRATLVRVADDDHRLQLNMHHIISDGWSMGVLMRELTVLYDAFASGRKSPLAELPLQYADYAQQQREYMSGARLAAELKYWREQLAGAPSVLELPTDRARPAVQSFRGGWQPFTVSAEVCAQLKRIGRAEGATLFMTLLAAFKALLYRYTGQEDLVVGTPIANRNRADIEAMIGFFVNTLVLRTQVRAEMSFVELLRGVLQVTLGAYGHQDLPFEKLVEELQPERNLSHNPLFQVMFALQNVPTMGTVSIQSAKHSDRPQITTDMAKFDLSLFMIEKESGLAGEVEYNLDVFDAQRIDRLIGHFQQLLGGVAHAPEQRLSELPLLTPAERHQLLVEWNDTETPVTSQCVHQLFEAQVERTPAAVAVVCDGEELSYTELNRRANQLAHYLRRRGVSPEVRVGICLERSLEMVVGILGILKAGGAYVPLDPSYPRDRLSYILNDAQVQVLLTRQPIANEFATSEITIIDLDNNRESITCESRDFLEGSEVGSGNLAYVIYTSGSTGRPKGVAMSHRSLANLIQWQIAAFESPGQAKTLQFAALSFDVSIQEIFSTWCLGGVLVTIPEKLREDFGKLLRYLTTERVERLFLPPVALQQIAEVSVREGIIPNSIREIITAGEQLKITPAVASFFASIGDCTVRNQYGPTESHVVTEYLLKDTPKTWPNLVPIGKPIANARIYVLDSNLQPVPIGVSGELHIGGIGLARGYLNRPKLTAEKFIPDPFSEELGARLYKSGDIARIMADGNVDFLGRFDHQTKIRGFRIEPGEVETVLREHPDVKDAIVIARKSSTGDNQLVAYFLPGDRLIPSTSELSRFMREKLPNYMIPSAFVELEAFPLSPNGKIDRKAFPSPDGTRPKLEETFVAPRDSIEETIAGIWRAVLGVNKVGIRDNFFELGGHSLLATQVISRIRDAFQVESLPLRRLFETPTVAELASAVSQIQVGRDS